MFEAIEPGKADYWDVVQKMRRLGVEVLYFGGYQHEAALIIRQAREHGYELHLVAGDGISNEDFGLIAGPASDGTLMTHSSDRRAVPRQPSSSARFAEDVRSSVSRLRCHPGLGAGGRDGRARSRPTAVAEALRTHEFDTVLGRIGFDAKGDVTGYDPFVWYLWKDGKYAPVEPGELTE